MVEFKPWVPKRRWVRRLLVVSISPLMLVWYLWQAAGEPLHDWWEEVRDVWQA